MAAQYLFVVFLFFATALGPTSIALLRDHLFKRLRPFARAIAEQVPAN
jgi:hypothetical protein